MTIKANPELWIYIVSGAAIALALIFSILSFENNKIDIEKKNENPTKTEVSVGLYFVNSGNFTWETERVKIANGEKTEILEAILRELTAGPKNQDLMKSVPESIITEAKIDVGLETAEISFSKDFHKLSHSESLICLTSLVYTLTELPFVTYVDIFIGDEKLLMADGKPIGLLDRGSFELSLSEVVNPIPDERVVILYFADKEGGYLKKEERVIKLVGNELIEKTIVEAIINGPTDKNLSPVIASDVKLNSAKTEAGMCFVDFGPNFVSKFTGGSVAEIMLIYSIVNSLTEPANETNIKKVQFLVDNATVFEKSGFSLDLSDVFERDEDWLSF